MPARRTPRTAASVARAITTVVIAAALPLAAPAPASAATMTAFADNGAQEALLSEMAIGPAAVERDGVTYIAYQGPGYDPYVVTWASATGWRGPYRAGHNPLRLDAHGAPALHIDAAGYLHLYYGSHGGALKHTLSTRALDPSAWTELPDVAPNATYPQVVTLPGGAVGLFCRASVGEPDWVLRVSTDDGTSFGAPTVVLDADADNHWYAHAETGPSGRLHVAFVRLDAAQVRANKVFVRYDVNYAVRDTSGTWRNAAGGALTMPLTRARADAACRLVSSSPLVTNEVTVKEDASGAPCVLYTIGSGAGADDYTWRFARYSDTQWRSADITTTDHYFDAACFEPLANGGFEAFVVTGRSDAEGSGDGNNRGRGGSIERFSSADGATWSPAGPIVPADEPGVLYSDPVLVRAHTGALRVVFTDWSDDGSNVWHRLFAWGPDGLISSEHTTTLERLGGADRIGTAVRISQRAFPEGAYAAVLAGRDAWPDALCGAPLAARLRAPLLLTDRDGLSDATYSEIMRLGVRRVTVLGGTGAVSGAVLNDLREAGVTSIDRASGADRYETAYEIARRLRDPSRRVDTCVLVDGRNWADAASVAPLAAANGWPIIPADGWIGRPTGRAIMNLYAPTGSTPTHGITRTIVTGGTGAVSAAVAAGYPGVVRVAGADRFETSAEIARFGLTEGLLLDRVHLATGLAFPDALAGASIASRNRGPILFVRPDDLGPAGGFLEVHGGRTRRVFVLGTEEVIGSPVAEQARSLANGDSR